MLKRYSLSVQGGVSVIEKGPGTFSIYVYTLVRVVHVNLMVFLYQTFLLDL